MDEVRRSVSPVVGRTTGGSAAGQPRVRSGRKRLCGANHTLGCILQRVNRFARGVRQFSCTRPPVLVQSGSSGRSNIPSWRRTTGRGAGVVPPVRRLVWRPAAGAPSSELPRSEPGPSGLGPSARRRADRAGGAAGHRRVPEAGHSFMDRHDPGPLALLERIAELEYHHQSRGMPGLAACGPSTCTSATRREADPTVAAEWTLGRKRPPAGGPHRVDGDRPTARSRI